MHTVTKVLVVFAAMLSVLLGALTMAYAVNADRIVADRKAESDRRVAADTMASSEIAKAAEEQARLREDIESLRAENGRQNTAVSQLQSERGGLIADKTAAVNRADAISAQTEQAIAMGKTQALLIQQYRDEVTKLRDNELGYKRREIELTDRLNDLESARDVQDASIRALQEQLVEANRTIQSGGSNASKLSRGPYQPTFAVSARVVSTNTDRATGKPLATINVGSNNQIEKDMMLTITRGNTYVGNLIITKTDLGWAEGVIDYQGRKDVQVQPGDTVISLASR